MLFSAIAPEAGHMQKALVKKKLIYFTKTIPKFSESEPKKKAKKKKKTKPHTIPSHRRNNRKKGQINNKTVLFSEYKYY